MALIFYTSLLICALGADGGQVVGIPGALDPKLMSLGFASSIIDQNRGLPISHTSDTVQNPNPFSLFSPNVLGHEPVVGFPVVLDRMPTALGYASSIIDQSMDFPTVEYTSNTFQNNNPVLLFPPTVGEQEKTGFSVEEEYKKGYVTPERVAALRDWVSTQPHLPGKYITELDLVLAFNSSSGCLDDARQKLDHYFTVKTMFTDLFKDRVMTDWWFNNTLNASPMFDLPSTSKDGRKVLFLSFDKNAEEFDITDICKYVLMLLDMRQYMEGSWPGVIFIIDLQNFSEHHVDKIQQLPLLQKYFYYLEKVWLGSLDELHYINPSEAVCDLEVVLQESLSKDFFKKVYVHKNVTSLEKVFCIDHLPRESGGKAKSIKHYQGTAMNAFQKNQHIFIADRKKRVDERKRPGGPTNPCQITDVIKKALPDTFTRCEFCQPHSE